MATSLVDRILIDSSSLDLEQAGIESQDNLGAKRDAENGSPKDGLSSSKKRRYNTVYSDEDRAEVAKYALEHGNVAAIRHFMPRFNLPESTIRSFKKKYLEVLEEKQRSGESVEGLIVVPAKRKGRKPGSLNKYPKGYKYVRSWYD